MSFCTGSDDQKSRQSGLDASAVQSLGVSTFGRSKRAAGCLGSLHLRVSAHRDGLLEHLVLLLCRLHFGLHLLELLL